MDNFYFIVLSNVVLMSFVNIYFNRIIYKGQAYYSIQFIFLCFIILHSVYICLAKSIFSESVFIDIGAPFGLFYGPFFYIGLCLLMNDGTQFLKKQWIHFLPGGFFIPVFVILVFFYRENLDVLKVYSILMYSLICLQMILYTFFAYIKFNSVVRDKKSIAIMSQSIIVMLATALIFLAFVFSDLREKSNVFNSFVIYALMLSAVMIIFRYNLLILVRKFNYYKRSYKGKMFFDFFKEQVIEANAEKREDTAVVDIVVVPVLEEEEAVKYQKSRISDEEMKLYLEGLNKAWETKIYLNPDLTLELLSKTTRIPKYHLTQVFNLGLNSNFNKCINALRVQYAISLLDNRDNHDTIEEIMMQSGFNSRSSFYRTFKVYYDISPADYRKRSHL